MQLDQPSIYHACACTIMVFRLGICWKLIQRTLLDIVPRLRIKQPCTRVGIKHFFQLSDLAMKFFNICFQTFIALFQLFIRLENNGNFF
jgi:hypothetical protein